MTPKDTVSQLVHEATQLRNQAKQALLTGIHADEAPIVGDLLVKAFVPYGAKGLARGWGRTIRKSSKSNVSVQWRQKGELFLPRCESVVKNISINARNLPPRGNSDKLVKKFNRARRLKNPVSFFDTLINILNEIQSQDLIWNKDIPQELAHRKEIVRQEQIERANLQSESKDITRLAKSVNLLDKLSISQNLKQFPDVQRSILGALDRLQTFVCRIIFLFKKYLIWNKDIPQELAHRKEIVRQEQIERANLQSESKDITRLAKSVNLLDKLSISQNLKQFPDVQRSILGALDRLQTNDPDAERHCITSCRVAIESLCMKLGSCGDWKAGLRKIYPSETDQRQVKEVWNYLSGKGAHGGHIPTKDEAEYALKITIATIEQIIKSRGSR